MSITTGSSLYLIYHFNFFTYDSCLLFAFCTYLHMQHQHNGRSSSRLATSGFHSQKEHACTCLLLHVQAQHGAIPLQAGDRGAVRHVPDADGAVLAGRDRHPAEACPVRAKLVPKGRSIEYLRFRPKCRFNKQKQFACGHHVRTGSCDMPGVMLVV